MENNINTTQTDRNMNEGNKIPIFAHITICSRNDYLVKDLNIDEIYDRVIVVANGNEIFAYMPILGNDDLNIIERMMQTMIHARKVISG